MTTIKLSEIANVWTGYAFRESINTLKSGECSILQASDVPLGAIMNDTSTLSKIGIKPKNAKTLYKGDIVVIARAYPGAPFRAMLYNSEDNKVVPTSAVHVISAIDDSCIPEYLLSIIVSPKIQRYFATSTAGASTSQLSRILLQDMIIDIHSIEKQSKYINIVNGIKKQKELIIKKIKLLDSIQNNLINNI